MANETYTQMPASPACRQQPPVPDETGLRPPWAPDGAPGSRDVWIYSEPGGGAVPGAVPAPSLPEAAGGVINIRDPGGTPDVPLPGMNGGEPAGGAPSAAAQQERMRNPVSMTGTHMPGDAKEAYQASLRCLLERNVGYFVVGTFLIGTGQSVTWQGILHSVGSDYLVLYQPDYERYISCDIYSLKFMQFHNAKGIPYAAAAQSWQGQIHY